MGIIIIRADDSDNVLFQKIVSILTENQIDKLQIVPCSVLSFPGLEIKPHQRRVLRDGTDINLTRLEYGTLTYLASSPRRVFTQTQIFEAVWNMESDSCNSSVVNVIYSLRKKIEPDSKNPTYIKTVLGVGYKFDVKSTGE